MHVDGITQWWADNRPKAMQGVAVGGWVGDITNSLR